MTKDQQRDDYSDYSAAIEELRHLAREPFETPRELLRLRQRIATERERSHRRILETVAQQAHVDLQSILDEARRRNAVKRRYVTKTLTRLEAEASERARARQARVHRIRTQYIETFSDQLAAQAGKTELKFRDPITWSGDAQPGDCSYILGGVDPDPGTYEASAEIARSSDTPGMWLYPRIYSDTGDCEETRVGVTFQDLTYRMDPPTTSFAVSSIRVDLLGNGIASSVFGDPGCFTNINPNYVHSFVAMDVYIAQQVSGAWHQWPLLSDRIFEGTGEYVTQIRALLSGQTYPSNILIRKPEVGGGDLLCHVQVVCSAQPIGTDGRVRIDFGAENQHGIFVGGVALIGDFV